MSASHRVTPVPGVPSRRVGMLSTYPPKLCGLATFAAALGNELRRAGVRVDVVRVNDGDETTPFAAPVVAELHNGSADSIRRVATVLSRCDAVVVQHEYGIFGGADGDEIVTLLGLLEAPAIVVLHTVPLLPTVHQRQLLVEIGELAERVVVMSDMARQRLRAYSIDESKVITIPHGALTPKPERIRDVDPRDDETPQLLTWGLLGPGKGIEHVIAALAAIDEASRPRYTIAGVTHPKVRARDGDRYRQSLIDQAAALGVSAWVEFDDTYRDVGQLTRFIASATAVVLPYDSRDQVTSGVLVDAVAAGRPVIATAFPHAVELLGSGAGILVDHDDPVAMATALRRVVDDPQALAAMGAAASQLAPTLRWSAVADQYLNVVDELADISEPLAI